MADISVCLLERRARNSQVLFKSGNPPSDSRVGSYALYRDDLMLHTQRALGMLLSKQGHCLNRWIAIDGRGDNLSVFTSNMSFLVLSFSLFRIAVPGRARKQESQITNKACTN